MMGQLRLENMEDEPALDQAAALSHVHGDVAFLCTLASMFVVDAQPLTAEIRAAVEEQDGGRLMRAAHTLKGASQPFFAKAVIQASQTLETIGESGQMETAMTECRHLEVEINRLMTALDLFLLRGTGL